MKELKFVSDNQNDTMELGKVLAKLLPNGTTITFYGDLGAGKTTLVRGIGQGLNIEDIIQSPTFNIMKLYLKGDRPLIHIDAYRLNDINTDIGLDEYIGIENGITVIEWPMYIENLLPKERVIIDIEYVGDNERDITLKAKDEIIEDLKRCSLFY